MFSTARTACAVLIVGVVASAANSQTPTSPALIGQGPAASTKLTYKPAFEGYQRFSDEKVGSWRGANDNVGRIGGWREYAKEAQGASGSQGGHGGQADAAAPAAQPRSATPPQGAASAPAASPRPAAPASPGQGPHSGHGRQ